MSWQTKLGLWLKWGTGGGPLTLSGMKSRAYAPDLLFENCDQMVVCTANYTHTGFAQVIENLESHGI